MWQGLNGYYGKALEPTNLNLINCWQIPITLYGRHHTQKTSDVTQLPLQRICQFNGTNDKSCTRNENDFQLKTICSRTHIAYMVWFRSASNFKYNIFRSQPNSCYWKLEKKTENLKKEWLCMASRIKVIF